MFYEKYWLNINGRMKDFDLKWPKLQRYIPRENGLQIVDLGCGNGEILKEILLINPHAKYVGLDVSDAALADASKKLSNVTFYKIFDGSKLPLPDESVDFNFTSEVIEHVYDVENIFSEINRVLKVNGQVLLSTPYHGIIKNILLVLFNFDEHFDPIGPHIRFFSKSSLFYCLRKSGLKLLKHGYFGRFYPIPHCIFVLAKKSES